MRVRTATAAAVLALWTAAPCGRSEEGRRPASAAEPLRVRVAVTDTVLRAKMPRIGFNVCQNPIEDKSTLLYNCLNSNPGMETQTLCRQLLSARAGDARSFDVAANFCPDWYPRIMAGAEFRVLDGKAAGRSGKIAAIAFYPTQRRLTFKAEGDGVAFAAGDLIGLNAPSSRAGMGYPGMRDPLDLACVNSDEHAPFYGGTSCARLVVDKGWHMPLFFTQAFKRHGGGRGGEREGNADRFLQEKTYRITLWAKGTPGAKGSVRFVSSSEPGNPQADDFILTDTWRKYELIRKSNPMVNLFVAISGGGSDMCIDDFTISEDDGGNPFAILPRVVDALADLKPAVLRLLGGARGESLDNWLAHPLERRRSLDVSSVAPWLSGFRDPDQPNLPDGLDLCERVGASPWLVVGLAMTDEEWDRLLEYLAGPADSPYGAKRAAAGQPDSWIRTFDRVYLELGDEAWNKAKGPWIVSDPAQYAVWAERVFSRVKRSQYYSPKIRLVANGNAADPKWDETVLKGCPSMDALSCSVEMGVAPNTESAAAPAQLLARPMVHSKAQLAAAAAAARAAGKALLLGGCSTASTEPSFLGPERRLLRSQGAAVAVLDELLQAVAAGSEEVVFSRFAQGADNATHVDAHSMALHPAAQGIRLLNHRVGGKDWVRCSIEPPPDAPAPGVPGLAACAFKGEDGYGVLLLNCTLDKTYRVALAVPGKDSRAHGFRIASSDLLANNLNENQVKTTEFDCDTAAGILVSPYSIVLVETGVAQ